MPPFWSILKINRWYTRLVSKWLWHVVTHFFSNQVSCTAEAGCLQNGFIQLPHCEEFILSSLQVPAKALGAPSSRNLKMCWCQAALLRLPYLVGHSSGLAILKWCVHVDVAYTPISAGLFYCLSCHVIALGSQEGLEWDNDVRKGLASLAARQTQN